MIMVLFSFILVFLFGLVIGSFLNCVIYRLEKGSSFLQGRSFCPRCQHRLGFWDLIPVLSFFLLRGHCRYCHEKISWQYPLVETATGALFLLIFNFQFSIFFYLIVPFLIVIFVYDLKHYLIPDKVIYPAIVLTIVYLIWSGWNFDYLWSALITTGFFLAIVLLSRGKWMGIGDIKLGFLIGLLLSWPGTLVALFLAFMGGAIIGTGLIASGRKTLKSEVPFGPFLVFGTLVSLFYGQAIINWYLNLL